MDLLLNQRLLPGLIPLDETNSDNAICYQNPTVLCRTLQEGVRENVATWYISPERMLVETIVMAMVFLAFLRVAFSGASGEGKGISLRLPAPVFFVTIVLYGLQIRFKLMGYRLKFLFLLMPCNLLQLLAVLLGLPDGIVSRKVKFAIVNLLYSFQVLVWIVFIESDTRDLKESFEVEYFWVYHFVLLFLPLFYLFTGRVVVGRKGFFKVSELTFMKQNSCSSSHRISNLPNSPPVVAGKCVEFRTSVHFFCHNNIYIYRNEHQLHALPSPCFCRNRGQLQGAVCGSNWVVVRCE